MTILAILLAAIPNALAYYFMMGLVMEEKPKPEEKKVLIISSYILGLITSFFMILLK